MNAKTWAEIETAIQDLLFPEQFDLIVAIANGGIIPAALINQRMLIPIELIKLSFRDPKQKPMSAARRVQRWNWQSLFFLQQSW